MHHTIITNGAMWGCDPRKAFPGDPRSYWGWGCYSSVISKSISNVLKNKNSKYVEMKELKNVSLSDLCSTYIKDGIPVIIWGTIDMATPQNSTVFYIEGTGERFTWIYPFHCLVLVGYDANNYYFNDPMAGKSVAYSKSQVETAYKALGNQAIVVYKEKPYEDTPFLDISKHWAKDYIKQSYLEKWFSGTSQNEFSPNRAMTRAMAVAVMHRIAGEPSVDSMSSFVDVTSDQYYANAVEWAYVNGIITGTGESCFTPNAEITREDFVTMLYRYAMMTEYEFVYADLSEFTDADEISSYAIDAFSWAVGSGIIAGVPGKSGLALNPRGTATRAEVAAVLVRFVEYLK